VQISIDDNTNFELYKVASKTFYPPIEQDKLSEKLSFFRHKHGHSRPDWKGEYFIDISRGIKLFGLLRS